MSLCLPSLFIKPDLSALQKCLCKYQCQTNAAKQFLLVSSCMGMQEPLFQLHGILLLLKHTGMAALCEGIFYKELWHKDTL